VSPSVAGEYTPIANATITDAPIIDANAHIGDEHAVIADVDAVPAANNYLTTTPYNNLNVKRYLINYPHLSDYGQTIFCLSFPSRDRATAPGQYEQFYFTEHVPYPQKKYISRTQSDQKIRYNFCNSFCVQHKMVGDDYPFIIQCLVYHKKGTVHHWGILTRP
jgi:hypothetical protein